MANEKISLYLNQNNLTTDLDQVLAKFGLTNDKDFVISQINDFLVGRTNDSQFFASLLRKGNVTYANLGQVMLAFKEKILDSKTINAFKATQITIEKAPASSAESEFDVPVEERQEDKIFHGFLDYLKSLKLKSDHERRLFNTFLTYFKGIRDEFETKENLSKEVGLGGLGFREPIAYDVIKKFNETIATINENGIEAPYIIEWFKKHYDVIASQPITTGAVDLPLPEEKVTLEEHHQTVEVKSPDRGVDELLTETKLKQEIKPLIVTKPSHDLDQPLPQHIAMHQKEVSAPAEIAGPVVVKKEMIEGTGTDRPSAPPTTGGQEPDRPSAPPTTGGEPGRSKSEQGPAPTPTTTTTPVTTPTSTPVTTPTPTPTPAVMPSLSQVAGPMNDMASVSIKPVRADLPLATKKIPEELKQMLVQDLGATLPVMPVPVKEVKTKPAKVSFFKKLFGKKAKSVSPSTPDLRSSIPAQPSTFELRPSNSVVSPIRNSMDDITHSTKLFGPVDELLSLSLADFRRLAKDPVVACKKIKDKIELLAHESLDKRAEAISALTKSELYRQYSDIMNASVMEAKPFTEILTAKKTMTELEFRALMGLNKELRS